MAGHEQRIISEDNQDLGFGAKVAEESRLRLLNRDGTFNVARGGFSWLRSHNPFHLLLTIPWWKFHLFILTLYCTINTLFALAFLLLCGDGVEGLKGATMGRRFLELFFFSVQTFTTVGYGHISPASLTANLIAGMDSFIGLFSFAFATGVLFARFTRPSAKILFSNNALIAPYQNLTAFEFRIANARRSQLIELEVRVIVTLREQFDGGRERRFHELSLERRTVPFLPLHLTVVHPIDEKSPLHGLTEEDCRRAETEFLILITAIDETFSQAVHARTSYRFDEIVWKAKFKSMFRDAENGKVGIDLHRINDYELLIGTQEIKQPS